MAATKFNNWATTSKNKKKAGEKDKPCHTCFRPLRQVEKEQYVCDGAKCSNRGTIVHRKASA